MSFFLKRYLTNIQIIIILIFNLDEIDAKSLGTVDGTFTYIMFNIMFKKIEKFEIVSK